MSITVEWMKANEGIAKPFTDDPRDDLFADYYLGTPSTTHFATFFLTKRAAWEHAIKTNGDDPVAYHYSLIDGDANVWICRWIVESEVQS